jgi:plasmid stability protein
MPAHAAYDAGMQYTIRKIPHEVDKALRRKARKEGKSLNEIAVEALARGAGVETVVTENRDLEFAIGSWIEDPEFDKTIDDQRQIDPDLWK